MISGPSGAGKGTLVTRVRERRSNLGLTVSATTRAPRKGEVDGVNYFFLTREEFDRRVANGEFVEWAEVHGNCYGTLVSEVQSKLASGASLILEIDVQGALQVKERFPEAVLIFIKPPSLEVLRERLVGRGTETPETIELRMANAADELALADRYDDVVVNDDLDRATAELVRVPPSAPATSIACCVASTTACLPSRMSMTSPSGFPVPIPSRWLWTRLSTATSLTTRPVTRRRSATRLLKPKWRLASAWSTITRLD